MEPDPDELVRLIAALPRKQQLDLILAILSRIALTLDSSLPGASPTSPHPFKAPAVDQVRAVLSTLTAPDAALLAALVYVSAQTHPDVHFGTEELNQVIGESRNNRLNVQALNPLCVDHYLTAVPSASSGRKRFKFTPLGMEKAKLVAREMLGESGDQSP